MTLQRYQTCLGFLNLPSNELEWFPKWLKAYSAFPSVVADRTSQPDHSVKREIDSLDVRWAGPLRRTITIRIWLPVKATPV